MNEITHKSFRSRSNPSKTFSLGAYDDASEDAHLLDCFVAITMNASILNHQASVFQLLGSLLIASTPNDHALTIAD
jgi:hypothetical protein